MPFTYSIAYGLIAGILTYALLNGLVVLIEVLSGGRIVSENREFRDPWSYKGRLKDFWREDEHVHGLLF
ncbi:hypothetical protein McanMca71_007009 [Microsporum canis]